MFDASVYLAALAAALCLGIAAAVRHFGRIHGEPERKVRALTWGFVAAAPLAAVSIHGIDSHLRRTTLHEELLDGHVPPGATREHVVLVDVEHPGVEHVLVVAPIPPRIASASAPCAVAVRWTSPLGQVLLDDQRDAPTELANRLGLRSVWSSVSWRFTPGTAGRHVLRVAIAQPGVDRILVRVADPMKQDGERAPGY